MGMPPFFKPSTMTTIKKNKTKISQRKNQSQFPVYLRKLFISLCVCVFYMPYLSFVNSLEIINTPGLSVWIILFVIVGTYFLNYKKKKEA